ncbi:hypothetical protein Gasu2_18430 [Galdieria sulphuraria]|nr:hypothetical protein Gasu2_18430 [Galdieria sulphuraria]
MPIPATKRLFHYRGVPDCRGFLSKIVTRSKSSSSWITFCGVVELCQFLMLCQVIKRDCPFSRPSRSKMEQPLHLTVFRLVSEEVISGGSLSVRGIAVVDQGSSLIFSICTFGFSVYPAFAKRSVSLPEFQNLIRLVGLFERGTI